MPQHHPRGAAAAVSTGNSITTSFSHLFTRTPSTSGHHSISIDDDGDIEPPVTRNCGYSKPFLLLDMIWNLSFVIVSVFVLLTTIGEKPSTPLRLWIFGYGLQCLLHVGFLWAEFQRPNFDDDDDDGDFHFWRVFSFSGLCHNSIIKKLESVNTIVSSVWWVFGFYWIVMGGHPLLQESPRLYWLSVVFLAFDVLFMIFCIAMACVIFLFLFICFPILATVAYAMTIGDGASEKDISSLPKYFYRPIETFDNDKKREPSLMANSISTAELVLHPDDSECCICLYKYADGAELCTLPCRHHFHHKCITKWLRINATCPLCKFNILRGETLV